MPPWCRMSRLLRAAIHTGYHNTVTDIPDRKQAVSYGLAFATGCRPPRARRMRSVRRDRNLDRRGGHLRFDCSLYLGASQRGWPRDALFGLTKLHREVLRAYTATRTHARGGGVAPHSPPSGHVRTLSAPHADGQTRTTPYRGVQLSGGGIWRWGRPIMRLAKRWELMFCPSSLR